MALSLELKLRLQNARQAAGQLDQLHRHAKQAAEGLKTNSDALKKLNANAKNLEGLRNARAKIRAVTQQLNKNSQAQTHAKTKLDAAQNSQEAHRATLQTARAELSTFNRTLARNGALTTAQMQAHAKAKAALEQANASYNKAKAATTKHRQTLGKLARQHTGLQNQQAKTNDRLTTLKSKLDAAGVSTNRTGSQARKFRQETEALTHAIKRQQDTLAHANNRQKSYNRTMAQSHAAVGRARNNALTGVAYTYAAGRGAQGAAGFLSEGAQFDAGMSRVQALTRLNATSEELKELRNNARELGATTSYSANQVGGAQAYLAMGGFKPTQITRAMPGVLNMAKAGDLELDQSADISSNILGGFKLQAGKMNMVGDVLTKTFTTSNTTLSMLGETMKYVGPVAANAGVDLADAAAMAGLLGNVGIQGSESGTALRAMLLRLSAPTSAAKSALDGLGITVADTNGNMRNTTEILEDMAYATRGMGDVERLGVLKDIFGERPAASMLELLNQAGSGNLREYITSVRDSQGEAMRVAKVMTDNLSGDLLNTQSAWADFKIQVFGENNQLLRELVQSLTARIRQLGEWAKQNPEAVKFWSKFAARGLIAVAVLGALSAAMFGFLVPLIAMRIAMSYLGFRFLPLLISGFKGVFSVLGSMGGGLLRASKALRLVGTAIVFVGRMALANPIGLLITGIALAGFAIYKYWQPIKAFFSGFASEMGKHFKPLGVLFDWLGDIAEALITKLSTKFEWFANAIEKAKSIASAALDFFKDFGKQEQFTTQQLDVATDNGKAFAEYLGTLGNILKNNNPLAGVGKFISDGLILGLDKTFPSVRKKITDLAAGIKSDFTSWLQIRSPSRVFVGYGENTLQGYVLGLQKQQPATLKQINTTSKNIVQLSKKQLGGVALASVLSVPAAAIPWDNSAPVSAQQTHAPAAGDTIAINIYPTPGMNEQQVALQVQQILEQRDREKARNYRGRLRD